MIHLGPRQRQHPTKEVPHNGVTRQRRRSVDAIATSQIVRRVDEDEAVAESERHARQDGRDPVHGWPSRPGEPELADGDQHAADADDADGGLGGDLPGYWVAGMSRDDASEEWFC